MGNPFTPTSVSSYNANPPADDGSQVAPNIVAWSTIKTKLNDPIKSAFDTSETAINSAFSKIVGGAGITSASSNYTVLLADQGKLVKITGSGGITLTTPDATSVGAPFVFAYLNASSSSITLAGNNPGVQQTIDGVNSTTVPVGSGGFMFTDGTNWNTAGQQGLLVGKQLMYGDIINGTIAESNASNAVTFSLKTLAGSDPSANDPVLLCFRNVTSTTGNYVYRSVSAALSLTISAGSTMGTSNSTACRIWIVLFDDAGTIRMGAINCLSSTNIYPLGRNPIASSTAEGGAGAADSAQVFYTGTAVTSKPYLILGHATYESGLSTAGNWNVGPNLRLMGPTDPLPGALIQVQENYTGAVATGTTVVPADDTIPQSTEGDQYMSQSITPVSAANLLRIHHSGNYANNGGVVGAVSLFRDSGTDALAVRGLDLAANAMQTPTIDWAALAGTTSSTTFKIRMGASGSTNTFNGRAGSRIFGGALDSHLRVEEIVI